jgi:hypothetical protein
MREQITNDVLTCTICQTQKKQSKKYGLLPEKDAEAIPWDRLCGDLIGPKSEDNAAVTAIQKVFGVISEEKFQKNAHTQSHTWFDCDDSGHVLYGSENDVAVLVNGLVRDIVKALGLLSKCS